MNNRFVRIFTELRYIVQCTPLLYTHLHPHTHTQTIFNRKKLQQKQGNTLFHGKLLAFSGKKFSKAYSIETILTKIAPKLIALCL